MNKECLNKMGAFLRHMEGKDLAMPLPLVQF